jgi:hypothetical protein
MNTKWIKWIINVENKMDSERLTEYDIYTE